MGVSDRRFGFRVPLEVFLDQYVDDQRFRVLTTNISETGVFVESAVSASAMGPRDGQTVAIELYLPGVTDSLWARGTVCFQRRGDLVCGAGIRFTAMATPHARVLRDFCVEARKQRLSGLLAAIRGPALQTA